jgi:CRP-like cAMP-binding protein
MTAQLKDFISTYAAFSEAELNEVTGRFKAKKVKKGEYLFREGDICTDLVFVQEGCLRLFYLDKDVEISVWFAFENSSAIDIYSFISEKPTTYFLQAIEETDILFLPKTGLVKLYQTHPKMQEMMRNFWEVAILTLIDRFTALQRDTADGKTAIPAKNTSKIPGLFYRRNADLTEPHSQKYPLTFVAKR